MYHISITSIFHILKREFNPGLESNVKLNSMYILKR